MPTSRSLSLALVALLAPACGGSGGHSGSANSAPGDRFFLPTGAVGANVSPPSVEVDAGGTVHAVYPAYIGSGAFYAECGADCGGASDMRVVSLPSPDTVLNAALALDAAGHPRVLMVTRAQVIYATCDADCGRASGWTVSPIIEHGGARDVTGEAFALDPQGRPRFVMHTHLTYFGVGQGDPATEWAQCDADCNDPASWSRSQISGQIWARNTLRFDATGRAHLALVATVHDDNTLVDVAAYRTCTGDCGNGDSWTGISFGPAFRSANDAVTVEDTISLALTRAGAPRVTYLSAGDGGARRLAYFQCNAASCEADAAWSGRVLTDNARLGPGVDLALDAQDHPRLAYTFDYNIGLATCDGADCADDNTAWKLAVVEGGTQIPTDNIFLYPNCSVGAWLLHNPSVSIAPDGRPRVVYNARDASTGGVYATDPGAGACAAGTDMILGRIALLNRL